MDRRVFIAVAGASILPAPLAAGAQQAGTLYRIGLLGGSPPNSRGGRRAWEGFFQGLRELGYVEGQNVLVEGRWYGERTDRLPALAAELVRLKVDLIVAGAAPAPEAARRATSTIPIVMANHSDPVGSGLVASLARPGGNATGLLGNRRGDCGETPPAHAHEVLTAAAHRSHCASRGSSRSATSQTANL